MARQRTYYPDFAIETGLYTTGSEYQTTDGTEYVGLYHRYNTGEVYTLSSYDSELSKKLVPYNPVRTNSSEYSQITGLDLKKYENPDNESIRLTENDYQKGYFTRYFIQKRNDKTSLPVEVTKETAGKFGSKINSSYFILVKIEWKLTGTVDSIQSTNQKQLQNIQKDWPSFSTVDDYLKFARPNFG